MFEHIDNFFIKHPQIYDLLTALAPLFFLVLIMFCMNGCATYKETPVQYVEKIEYRDSTIYVTDTVTIEVPKEVIKEVVPQDTTSILRTSVALSEAKVYKGMLHHRLEQNGAIPVQIDTVITVQYVDRYIEKEIPVEVEVITYKRDTIYWFSIILNLLGILMFSFKFWLKIKGIS